MLNKDLSPLVSVVVISYNSGKYIEETLDSIYNQSYENIELIISDDGSADTTVLLANNWLEQKKQRFVNSAVLEVIENTGISSNLKRGIVSSSGEWIKSIAADDILTPDCVETYIAAANNSSEECFISNLTVLQDGKLSDYTVWQKYVDEFDALSVAQKSMYYTINSIFLHTPSLFLKRNLFDRFRLIDEKYKLLEDQPLFFGLLRNGINIVLLKAVTVIYRKHDSNLTVTASKGFLKNLDMAFDEYKKPVLETFFLGKVLIFLHNQNYKKSIKQKPSRLDREILKFYGILTSLIYKYLIKLIIKNKFKK